MNKIRKSVSNKNFPDYCWEKIEQDRYTNYWVLVHNGERLAIVDFMGGHVERPGSWILRLKDRPDQPINAPSLQYAIEEAEEYYGIGPVDKAAGKST